MVAVVAVMQVDGVELFGENLSVVKVGDNQVIANRKEDGSLRWADGETVLYVPLEAVIPDDVLKERGYFDEAKDKGMLGGKRGNRVKIRRFGPEEDRRESVGLLFKLEPGYHESVATFFVTRGEERRNIADGDLDAFLGITA